MAIRYNSFVCVECKKPINVEAIEIDFDGEKEDLELAGTCNHCGYLNVFHIELKKVT